MEKKGKRKEEGRRSITSYENRIIPQDSPISLLSTFFVPIENLCTRSTTTFLHSFWRFLLDSLHPKPTRSRIFIIVMILIFQFFSMPFFIKKKFFNHLSAHHSDDYAHKKVIHSNKTQLWRLMRTNDTFLMIFN